MEALYKKLYSKYTKLKKEKDSELDKLNLDQEVKFINYVAAAEEMIEYMKNENERLHRQVDELKRELASTRSYNDDQNVDYHKLWMEENQINKELTEEIARLHKLEHNKCSHRFVNEEGESAQRTSLEDNSCEGMPRNSVKKLMKKRKAVRSAEDTASLCDVDIELDNPADRRVSGVEDRGPPPSIQQPLCCQRKIHSSGGDDTDTGSVNCVFQYLVEFVVGMKFSLIQSDELCIMAQHQSSGYSFSLTWIKNSQKDTELLYRVLSMGTLERVAPEWMKETVIFHTTMCSLFFERVSRVIKH